MGPALGDVLPLAAAIALFPIPVLAVILMLFSPRASTNVPGFLAGWLTGLLAILVVTALLTTGVEEAADEDAVETIGWIRIIIGAVLLLFALKKWIGRPDAGSDPEMPKWMSAIDDFTPVKALGTGLALTALNPKNIALIIGAGTAVGAPGLTTAESIIVGLVFTIVATFGVGLPPLYAAFGGSAARRNLDASRTWLIANNVVVMTLLMLIIGVVLIGEGLRLF
jgi:threonine/homoserine/homoserine lactone efflux protein